MVEFDDTHFPLILVSLAGELDELASQAARAGFEAAIVRAEREAREAWLLVDGRRVTTTHARFRKNMASYAASVPAERFAHMGPRLVLSPSFVLRGAVTAISWVAPKLRSTEVYSDVDAVLSRLSTLQATLEPDFPAAATSAASAFLRGRTRGAKR